MASVSIWEIWRHSPGEMEEVRGGVYQDRWKSSYLLSWHVVLVAAVSVIGRGVVLKPAIKNERRKIDSLTDDHEMGRLRECF